MLAICSWIRGEATSMKFTYFSCWKYRSSQMRLCNVAFCFFCKSRILFKFNRISNKWPTWSELLSPSYTFWSSLILISRNRWKCLGTLCLFRILLKLKFGYSMISKTSISPWAVAAAKNGTAFISCLLCYVLKIRYGKNKGSGLPASKPPLSRIGEWSSARFFLNFEKFSLIASIDAS